jgi:multimeric flavodoxin WrbA
MKLLVLMSSLRKKGNTDQVVDILRENLYKIAAINKDTIEIETLKMGDLQIAPCRGCRICFDRGEEFCPLRDDMTEIKNKIKTADGIIVASPVYVDDINGVMKNWIDRLAHVCHRPEFAGKSAYLLVTVGSTRTGHALRTLDTALRTWGFYIIGKAGFKTHAKTERNKIEALYGQRLNGIANRVFLSVKRQDYKKPSFVSLMIFKIQQIGWSRENPSTIDYQYWQKQGWLDHHCEFFIQHEASLLKANAARLVGSIVAKFML